MNEIEVRGKLNVKEFGEIMTFLRKNAVHTDEYNRLTIDISPGFNPKTKSWDQINKQLASEQIDIRLKKSEKSEKIVVKTGHYASKNREEFEIDIKEGELLDALKLFEALGYKSGMIYEWKSWIYKYKEFEIKISEYPNGYHEWEIEAETTGNDPNNLAKELSLKTFTEEEFQKEINWKNNSLHEMYSLEVVKKLLSKN